MMEKLNEYKNKPIVVLGAFVVVALAMILISVLSPLKVPVVAVCAIVILEAAMAALLNRIPIWVHGLIVIAQIVAGIVFGKIVFMILMAVVYVTAVALLYFWSTQDK